MWKLGYTLEEATPAGTSGPKKGQENSGKKLGSDTRGLGYTLDEVITILQLPQPKEKNPK